MNYHINFSGICALSRFVLERTIPVFAFIPALCVAVLLCAACYFPVSAQELTILTTKGAVSLQHAGTINAASAGMKFRDTDVLLAKAPCYVVVSSSEGKTLEIRTNLNASAKELYAKMKAASGTISGKVAGYIFGELKSSVPNVKDYQQNMASTAMTERSTQRANKDTGNELFGIASGETATTGESTSATNADEGIAKIITKNALDAIGLGGLFGGAVADSASAAAGASARAPRVRLLFPHDTYILDEGNKGNEVSLYWSCERPAQTFIVRVVSALGVVVFEKTTQDTSIRIHSNLVAADTAQCYRWSVQVQGFSPDVRPEEYCLSHPYKERLKAVMDTVATLRREVGRGTPLGYAASGVIYERNRFYLAAFAAYKEAMRLAPDTEEYTIALLRLIERWGVDYRFAFEQLANAVSTEFSGNKAQIKQATKDVRK